MALWTKATLCGKSSLLEQRLPRTPSRLKTSVISVAKNPFNPHNPRLINDLRSTKVYVRKNNLFMQNKANFQKVKFNVTEVLTRDYDQMDTWSIRTTKPIQSQSKPIQSQLKPIQSQLKPIKANSNPIKANFRGKKMLRMKINTRPNPLAHYTDQIEAPNAYDRLTGKFRSRFKDSKYVSLEKL